MAWIESHQQLERHPKVNDLMNAMGWDLDTTIGKLHRFWWWCVDYAEDGDLSKHNHPRIAGAMGVSSDKAESLVTAMLSARWLDSEPYFRVHDWWDYIGLFLQRKYGDRHRSKWERVKQLYSNHTATIQLSAQQLSQPNLTVPNLTVQSTAVADAPAGDETPKKSPPAAKPKASTDQKPATFRELTDLWCSEYETFHGIKYPFVGAKDGGACARLLKTGLTPTEIVGVAKEAWKHPDWFNCKQAMDLSRFACAFLHIRNELKNPPTNGTPKPNPRNEGTGIDLAKQSASIVAAVARKQQRLAAEVAAARLASPGTGGAGGGC